MKIVVKTVVCESVCFYHYVDIDVLRLLWKYLYAFDSLVENGHDGNFFKMLPCLKFEFLILYCCIYVYSVLQVQLL